MSTSIRLIVGLANPGTDYAATRHNAGAWYVTELASSANQSLRYQAKFQGDVACITTNANPYWLLIPTTYMNHSGQAVRALAHFYKIQPEEILIAHDDLDFPPGVVRLKQGGSAGRHNGVQDVINHLSSPQFWRLRIGIGHPGHRDRVLAFVLGAPSREDRHQIDNAIAGAVAVTPQLLSGTIAQATQQLHS